MEREIIYVDIAAFAVTVERMVRPDLRTRPVIVAPVGTPRAMVTALSREAWDSGIRKGMLVAKARRYCRGLAVLPPNEPLYARASNAICRVLQGYSPVLEPSGYGHAYVDITGTGRLFGPPRDTAWKAQTEIRQRLRLEASFGVASNKMVSKIAAVVTKPVGLQDVRPGDERSFIAPLPVRLLPGVGPRTLEQLHEFNIQLVRDLTATELEHLTMAFGRLGFLLHQRARGIDNTPVYSPTAIPALEHEKVLPEDSNDLAVLKKCLFELCDRAGQRLRKEGQRAASLCLRVLYADYRDDAGREKLAAPAQSTAALYARAEPLLERILSRRIRVRSIRLRLTDLTRGPAQLNLFTDPKSERSRNLEMALDVLRRRFGEKTVTSNGSALRPTERTHH
jgi:DNA polymerase-4